MRRLLFACLLVFGSAWGCSLNAQVMDASVCAILANPQSFNGKIVRVKGTVVAGFEEFAIRGTGCNQPVNAIWLAYPGGTAGKAGPVAFLRLQLGRNHPGTVATDSRAAVALDKNKDFKDFDALLSTTAKTSGLCLGCTKFTVSATLTGRLDATKDTGLVRDAAGKVVGVAGFGHLNRYNARLVLQSVSESPPRKSTTRMEGRRCLAHHLRRRRPLRIRSNEQPTLLGHQARITALNSASKERTKFPRMTRPNPTRTHRMGSCSTSYSMVTG